MTTLSPGGLPHPTGTIAVTVTYGRRDHLVTRAVQAALDAGASHVVIVDNGTPSGLPDLPAGWLSAGQVSCIRSDTNQGSAWGFRAGIAAALGRRPAHVLLLDDDNLIPPDYLTRLLGLIARGGTPICAALGFRKDHAQADVVAAESLRRRHVGNSFLGFHVLDLPAKILSRLGPSSDAPVAPGIVREVETAPYGGLLLPAALFDIIGLPDERFLLYQDDMEFTLRITRNGGKILLAPDLIIDDMDSSWTAKGGPRSAIAVWLTGGPEFRVFYTMRNHCHLDRRRRCSQASVFALNVLIYATLLILLALCSGRFRRAKVMTKAIRDGLTGRLGEDPGFALP